MLPDFDALFSKYKIVVSRETIEKLSIYAQLLLKWQKSINLVGPLTLDDIGTRHFIDSAQVFQYIPHPEKARLADLGSGAGFPGMVLAIMGVKDVHLVESDVRKATFLREVSRETKTPVTIHDMRIEECRIENVNVFTARALAPLGILIRHINSLKTNQCSSQALLMKGEKYQDEMDSLSKDSNYKIKIFPSITDNAGKILNITLD